MNPRPTRHSRRRGMRALAPRGFITISVVLILLAVMLLGALALARMTEASTTVGWKRFLSATRRYTLRRWA
jgi:hypothetical protein